MVMDTALHSFDAIFALLVVDLLLSGDNAMVIALACRSLPPVQKRQAMLIGTGGAVVMRILLTTVAGFLLQVPLLKLAGGALLVIIAIKLLLDEDNEAGDEAHGPAATDLWAAVVTVVTADLIMSLDNVVGLAAVAQGSVLLLTLGLLISMPLLMFGSLFVSTLLARYPLMVRGGGALLGWIAGDIAMSDALIADWVNQQSPALTVVVPALTAAFVLLQSRIIAQRRPALAALRQRIEKARPARATAPPRAPAGAAADVRPEAPARLAAPLASPPPAAATPAIAAPAPAVRPARPRPPPRDEPPGISPRMFWLRAAAVVAFLTVMPVLYVNFWMPNRVHLQTYSCSPVHATLSYHEGQPAVHLDLGSAFATGTVGLHHNIEWGDYHAVSVALGAAPPTHIEPSGSQSVVLTGGSFDHVECQLHTAAAP